LLNDDTIIKPDWLDKLPNVLKLDENIGSCQPKILSLINPDIIDAFGIYITDTGEQNQYEFS
jgi:GT2 family glycosyltransferase